MSSPLVSIVVPIYNTEKYLKECINSLLNQHYNRIQIILVDDGSTDNSGAICDSFNRRYENIVTLHTENRGVSKARNEGLGACIGDYVLFIDSDDIAEPNMIELMLERSASTGADVVICGIDLFNTNYYRQKKHRKSSPITDLCEVSIRELAEYASNNPLDPYFGAPYNKLIRRELLIKNGLVFDDKVALAEDTSFNYLLFSYANKIGIVQEILFHHRLNAGSSLSRSRHQCEQILERFKILYKCICDFLNCCEGSYLLGSYSDQLATFFIHQICKSTSESIHKRVGTLKAFKSMEIGSYKSTFSTMYDRNLFKLFCILYSFDINKNKLIKYTIIRINRFIKFF